jgi:PII-like signaling protein
VSPGYLKLTAFFGERQRVDGRLLADALLDVFGRHELATSIVLRGAAGFGPRHHLRTDQSLTASEDSTVVAIGVDTSDRVQGVVRDVTRLGGRGLFTLERARLARGDIDAVTLSPDLGEAAKLTVYVGRQQKTERVPAFVAVCDLLHRNGVAGASVLVGVDGTANGRRYRAKFFDGNADVPAMVIAVASGERVAAVLPQLAALLKRPLVTVERVRVCKRDGELLERPHHLPPVDDSGLGVWQKLMVHSSEASLYRGEPLHRALVRRLRASPATAGVTVLRGVWGFHGNHAPHGDKLVQLGRRVPVVTVLVDTPDRIAESFEVVDEVTCEHGLVTAEMVPAMLSVGAHGRRGGLRLARHDF